MQATRGIDILGDLASWHGADSEKVLAEMVEARSDNVLAHHVRSALARAAGIGQTDRPAIWESSV